MPHKRQKRSIRVANEKAIGFNNPPTAADSLLPIASTSHTGETLEVEPAKADEKRSNKRRKPAAGGAGAAGDKAPAGVSKSAWRVLNAGKLREEYHAIKKRKAEEEEQAKNPNQKKQKPALAPLPYESLATFNRRVEQEMRSDINAVIQKSKPSTQKKKENRKGKKKQGEDGEDEDAGGAAAAADDTEKVGKDGKKRPKPTPEESLDPFAPKRLQQPPQRGRTGKTEFDTASQIRRIDDVVQAPPTLAKPARKNLLEKVLGPGGAASDGSGAGAGFRLASAEEPVGSSRLPVNPAMKALLDQERERAVRMYRELREKKDKEKSG
ncbi:SPOSA6832_02045 [Sporobolomyces salmonicolor]|uniref:SPOSA6832_02045-mRNA-1:cds n=1 Tax=Sporidiobolus salmonicolor TaxID=5005 RepID=A0A0D6EKH1_SPOSA|nr:SPOSA6832_02045 [Sporobolomyces salmonicolor]